MTQFPGISSPEQANLDAILSSPTYRIAHEDPDLLNSNAMRGVRMLLEITKPDLHLETAGIESTIKTPQQRSWRKPSNGSVKLQAHRC